MSTDKSSNDDAQDKKNQEFFSSEPGKDKGFTIRGMEDMTPEERKEIENYFEELNDFFYTGESDNKIVLVTKYLSEKYLKLTFDVLENQVLPYIKSICDFQNIISFLHNKKNSDVVIRKITCFSPITIGLDGASDAIKEIRETISPFERKHREEIAKLRELELSADIALKQAQVNESKANKNQNEKQARLLTAQEVRLRVEAEKIKAEAQAIRAKTLELKVELAMKIIDKYGVDLSSNQKLAQLNKMITTIDTILDSDLVISNS